MVSFSFIRKCITWLIILIFGSVAEMYVAYSYIVIGNIQKLI